jgi:hypothetical protein
MKLYKLTDKNQKTFGGMEWGEGVTHSLSAIENPQLCTPDVIHAYTNINLAFLLNPIHADYYKPLVWEAEGEIIVKDFGKVGVFSLTTKRMLTPPKWIDTENEKRVRILFAILCAESVLNIFEEKYPTDKRPQKAIKEAKKYLFETSNDAAARATDAATCAADAATCAARDAYAATCAAAHAAACAAAHAAACAARAAAHAAACAAHAATHAACAAHAVGIFIDFGFLADKAVEGVEGIMEKIRNLK